MITGVIDIGTNTFNLLIKDAEGRIFYNDKIPVKLGKDGIMNRKIVPDAFMRGQNALREFKKICQEKQVDRLLAFATSAVREATNGRQFVQTAEEDLGIKINVIDGEKEAQFVYHGVRHALRMQKEPMLIIDIGGGSIEFIIANVDGVIWQHSYEIGVARLLAEFNPHDPITEGEIEKIQRFAEDMLSDLWVQITMHKPRVMVGSSGSFETIYKICAERFHHKILSEKETYGRIYMNEFDQVKKQLIGKSMLERTVIAGMETMRADTIHLATILIDYILKKTEINVLLYSCFALKEGVIYTADKEKEAWQISLL